MAVNNKKGSLYEHPKQDPKWSERWKGKEFREYKTTTYNKISELLISKFSQIEETFGINFQSLQKTFRDGKLQKGKSKDEMLVIFENDLDANSDQREQDLLFSWLDYADTNQLDLKVNKETVASDGSIIQPKGLELILPDKNSFNLNELIGTMDFNELKLKDNISQFIEIDKGITNIDRNKLSEFVDTEISELTPITFTYLLEKYKKIKNQIPFYRYRTDDFFEEYIASENVPVEYRIQKLFEEFERIKEEIPKGLLLSYNSFLQIPRSQFSEEELFGWETLTYLVSEAQTLIGTLNPIFSQADALSWVDEIDILEEYGADMSGSWDICEKRRAGIEDAVMAATGSLDEVIDYEEEKPVEEGVWIHAIGTGQNNPSPRKLTIGDTSHYPIEEGYGDGNGLRLTIISADSLTEGSWDGTIIHDLIYNIYSSDEDLNNMVEDIYGDWKMSDVFIVTSYYAVRYNKFLIEALKSIGGCHPRLVNGLGSNIDSVRRGGSTFRKERNYRKKFGPGGTVTPTQEQINMYDLNFDGVLDNLDIDLARTIGMESIAVAIENIFQSGQANLNVSTAMAEITQDTEITIQDVLTGEGLAEGDPNIVSTWGAPGDARTPYVLVGSRGVGECNGYEAVGDDGARTPPAEVKVLWVPDYAGEGGWDTGEPGPIPGCTDSEAENYVSYSTVDDGSCEYDVVEIDEAGCMDPTATNWDSVQNYTFDYCKNPNGFVSQTQCIDDSECTEHGDDWTCNGSCEYDVVEIDEAGCMDPTATNWDSVQNYTFDYCKNPNGFVSQTQCIDDSDCTEHGDDWTCNGSCTYTTGCTDPEANNYSPNAITDDGNCTYDGAGPEPVEVFSEGFDSWPDNYSPGPAWWRSDVGVVNKVDGPDSKAGIRIYRTKPTGEWPGAIVMRNTSDKRTLPEFNIINREPQLLWLEEGRTYKVEAYGRCNTTNKKAKIFLGDTRGGGSGGYSWEGWTSWNTNGVWTHKSFTVTAKKNKHLEGSSKFEVKWWKYDPAAGNPPSWGARQGGDDAPAKTEYHSKINWDWNTNWIQGIDNHYIMAEAKGWVNITTPGNYKFSVMHDDGAHLWVNGQHLVNDWTQGGDRWTTGEIYLDEPAEITTRFYEHQADASWKLKMKGPNDSDYVYAEAYSNPEFSRYPGVLGQIYMYSGTKHGGSPGQYCDYSDLKITKIAEGGGIFQTGGTIPSRDLSCPYPVGTKCSLNVDDGTCKACGCEWSIEPRSGIGFCGSQYTWEQCASEGNTCDITGAGTVPVRYHIGNSSGRLLDGTGNLFWKRSGNCYPTYKKATGTIGCNNSVFGNPCGEGIPQKCYYPKVTSSTTKLRFGDKIQHAKTKPVPTKNIQTGGPIASTANPGPTYEVNSTIILPTRGMGLQGNKPITMKNVKKASKLELIRKRNICKDEVSLIESLGGMSLQQMKIALDNYLKSNSPCLRSKVSFANGGMTCCSDTCGDAMGDGLVDILDIVNMVAVILGELEGGPCSDVNGDGYIDVFDIVMLIDHILWGNDLNCNLCTGGILGCNGEFYTEYGGQTITNPSDVTFLPTEAKYNRCGYCGGAPSSCHDCCSGLDFETCDGTKACYQADYVLENEYGYYVALGPQESTSCTWDYGDEICVYGSIEQGGLLKKGGRTQPQRFAIGGSAPKKYIKPEVQPFQPDEVPVLGVTRGPCEEYDEISNVCVKYECFIPEAKVLMGDGTTKQIKDIVVGDKVQGVHGINIVVNTPTFKLGNQPLHGFNGRNPFVTSMHPIMTDKGWANFNPELYKEQWPDDYKEIASFNESNEILQLNVGDSVAFWDNKIEYKSLEDYIEKEEHPNFKVYNLTLDNDHTFIVEGVVVHNKGAQQCDSNSMGSALCGLCCYSDPCVCSVSMIGACPESGRWVPATSQYGTSCTNLEDDTPSGCGCVFVAGCSNSSACNYDENVTVDDGTCWFANTGCSCDEPWGAVVDMCGVCDSDPTNNCTQDCAGDWGGSLENDECGVCGGDGSDDLGCGCFEAGPSGCDNVCGSTLENDECGICNGDGIGDGDCDCNGNVNDCAGICGGSTEVDECGICGGTGETEECGCEGIPDGACDCAGNILDDCGECGGGGTTLCDVLPNPYCPAGTGETFCSYIAEDFQNCPRNDECGICEGPGPIYECGCDGIPDGYCGCDYNEEDACGVCDGDGTSCLDDCGVSGGDNTTGCQCWDHMWPESPSYECSQLTNVNMCGLDGGAGCVWDGANCGCTGTCLYKDFPEYQRDFWCSLGICDEADLSMVVNPNHQWCCSDNYNWFKHEAPMSVGSFTCNIMNNTGTQSTYCDDGPECCDTFHGYGHGVYVFCSDEEQWDGSSDCPGIPWACCGCNGGYNPPEQPPWAPSRAQHNPGKNYILPQGDKLSAQQLFSSISSGEISNNGGNTMKKRKGGPRGLSVEQTRQPKQLSTSSGKLQKGGRTKSAPKRMARGGRTKPQSRRMATGGKNSKQNRRNKWDI